MEFSMFYRWAVLVFMLIAITGCNSGNKENASGSADAAADSAVEPENVPSIILVQLSSFEPADLFAEVTINNAESARYSGSDFPDGQWRIPARLNANQNNRITIKWFFRQQLLMEEFGDIFANTANAMLTPQLNYVNAGHPRFDDNCDGVSNLAEHYAGIASMNTSTVSPADCQIYTDNNTEPFAPDGSSLAGLLKYYDLAGDNSVTEQVFRVSQRMQISNVVADLKSDYGFAFMGKDDSGQSPEMSLVFRYHPTDGNTIVFGHNKAIEYQPAPDIAADCGSLTIFGGFTCSVPFDWQTQRWYEVYFDRLSPTTWEASIVDLETLTRTELGEMVGNEWLSLQSANMGMKYTDFIDHANCIEGLPPVSMRYYGAQVNNAITLTPNTFGATACLMQGGGVNDSTRQIGFDQLHTLTVGQL